MNLIRTSNFFEKADPPHRPAPNCGLLALFRLAMALEKGALESAVNYTRDIHQGKFLQWHLYNLARPNPIKSEMSLYHPAGRDASHDNYTDLLVGGDSESLKGQGRERQCVSTDLPTKTFLNRGGGGRTPH